KAITRAINSSHNEISDGIAGRTVKEGIKETSPDGDILNLQFGNEPIAGTGIDGQVADAGALNRVTSSDIDAFRERHAERLNRVTSSDIDAFMARRAEKHS